jgi:hypothetical protein
MEVSPLVGLSTLVGHVDPPQYHAPCHPSPALTFLLFPESVSTRNILASKEHLAGYTLSMPIQGVRSPVARARVSFMGVSEALVPSLNHRNAARYC